MRKALIGSLDVSVIGLGCNNFGRALDQGESMKVVHAALDAGITYFDTARNYGGGQSEEFLGRALSSRRGEVVIATKFGPIPGRPDSIGATKEDVAIAVEGSLRKLGTDYIDLYQLHFPSPVTPIAETLGAMSSLVEAGTVREIGCSNFDASQLEEALDVSLASGWASFVSDQVEFSMVHRLPEANGLVEVASGRDVAVLPYYPLASGLLTGKTKRGEPPQGRLSMERYGRFLTPENFDIVEGLVEFAASRQLDVAQVALAWLLTRPSVPAVTSGATRVSQVVANARAAEWQPDARDLAELEQLLSPPTADR